MRKLLATIATAITPSGCGPSEPPIAGTMTIRDVCQTSGYIIRQRLGNGFKTIDIPCTVTKPDDGLVLIRSGYISPINPNTINYEAVGQIERDRLKFISIKTEFDDQHIPIHQFP